ncbi:MAG: FkbM family methyltransferase [bacterium]
MLQKVLSGANKHIQSLVRNRLFGLDAMAKQYFSQFGEDACIQSYFRAKAYQTFGDVTKMEKGFYVDVGAYSPKKLSNTYWFYNQGWRGINIEPAPGSKKIFDAARPRDFNVEVAISNQEKESDFFVWAVPFVYNTLSKTKAEIFAKKLGRKPEKIKVQTQRLESILDRYLPAGQQISFFSIDVKGYILQVLQSNNWVKYRPELVAIEDFKTNIQELLDSEISKYMYKQGYILKYWVPPSSIYVKATFD